MQKIKRPRKFVWQRDVRLVIHPGIYRFPPKEAEQDSDIYILSRLGSTCAIVPRGIFAYAHDALARFTYYLKGFIEECYAENITTYLVILRGAYDIITAETILQMQKKYKTIKLICAEINDSHFITFKPSLRDRYRSILLKADELHSYNGDFSAGDAEALALTHTDRLLLIISEKKVHTWQRLIDTIWHDMHHTGDLLYNISQCRIVYMEWIMHQEMNDLDL